MATDLNRQRNNHNFSALDSHSQPSLSSIDTIYIGPENDDLEIDGMELSEAAQTLGISSDDLWRRIRNGILLARTYRGKVYVYTDLSTPSELKLELPPLPNEDSKLKISDVHPQSELMWPQSISSSEFGRPNQEIALLIDHLSLAKEENREILRLTQDSMARLTQMTDAILEMKDSVIASKEEQMTLLQAKLDDQTEQLVRTLKEKEDLETLTSMLTQG